jgi:dTDP-D-glucose 4,6-dehydratase
MKVIVTGGAGFIGANFLNQLVPALPEHQFVNVDKLTYAANLGSVRGIEALPNYTLRRVDITDRGPSKNKSPLGATTATMFAAAADKRVTSFTPENASR